LQQQRRPRGPIALDHATAILKVAVHKGFRALDTVPHVLTALAITDLLQVHVIEPTAVPDTNWRRPAIPSAGQQSFGDMLLAQNAFVVVPSTVSTRSWNLVFT